MRINRIRKRVLRQALCSDGVKKPRPATVNVTTGDHQPRFGYGQFRPLRHAACVRARTGAAANALEAIDQVVGGVAPERQPNSQNPLASISVGSLTSLRVFLTSPDFAVRSMEPAWDSSQSRRNQLRRNRRHRCHRRHCER